jgi:hypothetical protein
LLLVAAGLLCALLARGVRAPDHLDWVILAACGLGLLRPPGAHITAALPRVAISLLSLAIGIVGVLAWRRPRLARAPALVGVLLLSAVIGGLVIVESPRPRIDVFGRQQEGAEALLEGKNPYRVSYSNPYTVEQTQKYFGDVRGDLSEYPYPPLSLGLTTLGYLVGRDVRWTLLTAQLATPLLLFLLARRFGHSPSTALGLSVLQLVHPRGTFMLEQAWTDDLVGCAFLLVLHALASRSSARLGGALLGLFLASKQYSIVIMPLLWPHRMVPRAWWPFALGVAVLVAMPFVLWGPIDLFDDVVMYQLRLPSRADAMSLPGLIQCTTGIRLPGIVSVAAALAVLFAWSRKRVGAGHLALAAVSVYGAFFIMAKQAFCNYYYFVGVLLLAAAATTPTRDALRG